MDPAQAAAARAGGSELVTRMNDDQGENIRVAFHPTANIIAYGGSDHVVKICRFKTKEDETNQIVATTSRLDKYHEDDPEDREYYGHTIDITAIVFDPKYPIMITGSKYIPGSSHKTLKLWLLSDDGTKIHRCVGFDRESDVTDQGVLCIAVHPTLPVFIVGYTNKTVAFYYYDYKSPIDITIHPPKIYSKISSDATSLAFHPSEPVLMVGMNRGEMKMFKFNPDPSTREDMTAIYMFDTSIHRGAAIKSLAFHNVFPYILSQDYDGIMRLWSYSLNEVPQVNQLKFGPEIRSSIKNMCYAAAFHPREALILSATRTYVEFYGLNPENGLPIKIGDKTLTPFPIILSPLHPQQLRTDVDARSVTFTVGFHPSLDFCFTSYNNVIYIYKTFNVSSQAYQLRISNGKNLETVVMDSEMNNPDGVRRSKSAPNLLPYSGDEKLSEWQQLSKRAEMVGRNIGMFPPTMKKQLSIKKANNIKRSASAGEGGRRTSRSVKKIVRKTKKYRKRRITYRTRK